jgi:hypothetical protein
MVLIDDFEDGDTTVNPPNWSGWAGSISNVTSPALVGSNSGEMQEPPGGGIDADATRDTTGYQPRIIEFYLQVEQSPSTFLYSFRGNNSFFEFQFNESDLSVRGTNSTFSYNIGDIYRIRVTNIDYTNETYDYEIFNVSTSTTVGSDTGVSFFQSASGFTAFRISGANTGDTTDFIGQVDEVNALAEPRNLSVDSTTDTSVDLSWTQPPEAGARVFISTDGGSTFTNDSGDLAKGTSSYTASGLDNGKEYTFVIESFQDTDTLRSGTVTTTTVLPDAQQPTLDTSAEDEITASYTDVINNGDYRVQIREEGETEWNSNATGFAEEVVGQNTTSVTFGTLEDGEAYEVRLRTETADATGTFTSPVSGATVLPPPGSLSITSTSTTSVSLSWTDNADNEDGYRVYIAEKRLGSFRQDQVDATLGAGSTSYTADVKSGTTFRFRVETFTEDATSSDTVTATTDSLANATDAAGDVPATGPYLEIDHPSNGRTVTPQITGEVAPPRALNGLPTTRVPVAGDRWTADTWIGADCRLWIDGHRQPVESVVRPVQTPEGAELELRGGEALLKRVEQSVVEQEADDFVRDLLTAEAPDIAQTVDDPASTINSDTRVLSADATDEWTDRLPAAPYPDDDPRDVTANGTVRTQRIADFQEAEDGGTNGGDPLFNDILSGGEGVTLEAFSDSVQFNLAERPYPIPAGRSAVAVRVGYTGDTHPGFTIEVDGAQLAEVPAASSSAPIFGTQSELDMQYTDIGASDDLGEIAAGTTHTIRIEITEAASDGSGLTVDCGALYDTDYTSDTDESFTDGGPVAYPRIHPGAIDVVTDDADTIRQVVGGRAEASLTNTLRNQAIAISNDQGATYIEATNSETVEGAFQSGTTNIRARVTLSNYASGTDGQPVYDAGQELDLLDLFADLDDAPILVDQVYDGTIESIITEVAEFSDAFWEVQWDPDTKSQSVEWTFPGQREAEGDAPLVDYETSVDATSITEKAVVYGTSQSVSDEEVTLQHGTAVALEEQYNQPAQITIKSTPDGATTYERGSDYEYDPQAGEVTALSTGAIGDGETVAVDYETRVRGVYSLPSWSGDETVARTRTIPAATTDRSAETAARILVQQTSEPIHSATVTIEELPVQWGLVEMVSFVELPGSETFEIYSVGQGTGTQELQLGTRDTVDQVVSDLQTRLEATASKV